ncbi:MAG: zinc-ribbon domain containing protein [Vulcanimicrobiaceae bacterium]
MYTDETLTCNDCNNTFTFSSGEQEFFASKGFQNKPNRCPDCRTARKNAKGDGARAPREMHLVTCTECGQQAEVPFMPRGDKPVYCRDCFQKSRNALG